MAGPGWQIEALNLKKEIKSYIYVKQLESNKRRRIRDVSRCVPFNYHQVRGAVTQYLHTQFWQNRLGVQ